MKTATELLPHIVRITGEPEPTVKAVREHLAQGGVLPLSLARGKNPEKFGSEQLAAWLIGLCVDAPHRAVASVTREYLDLRAANGATAWHALASLIESFKLKTDLNKVTAEAACKTRVVVDVGTPRITLTIAAGDRTFQSVFGPQGPQWADENVRKSYSISGRVIHDLSVGLHHNTWSH